MNDLTASIEMSPDFKRQSQHLLRGKLYESSEEESYRLAAEHDYEGDCTLEPIQELEITNTTNMHSESE